MSVYDYPLYYEIAFSYQEVKRQVDYFETVAKKFCKRQAQTYLDIACGPSPQLREIARRGYEAVGLDINPTMLDYLRQKVAEENLHIQTVEADLRDFKLRRKFDFAFCLSGSAKVTSNDEFLKHLKCVSRCLNQGGIYLLENVAIELLSPLKPMRRQEWTMKIDEIEIKTTYGATVSDFIAQLSEEKLVLEVSDHGKRRELVTVDCSKDFAPQELKLLIETSGFFGFLGFFKHLSLEPLQSNFNDNIILMQKRQSQP